MKMENLRENQMKTIFILFQFKIQDINFASLLLYNICIYIYILHVIILLYNSILSNK